MSPRVTPCGKANPFEGGSRSESERETRDESRGVDPKPV